MRVTEIVGRVDDEYHVVDVINEHIKNLESNYDVRVISIDVNKGSVSEYCKYSVWLELRRRNK